MLINRQLRIALLISFLWHLFWISSVSVVFLPATFNPHDYSRINFLGSILQEKSSTFKTLPALTKLIEIPPEANINKLSLFTTEPFTLFATEKKFLHSNLLIDIDKPEKSLPFKEARRSSGNTNREILFRPSFPQYPEWTQQQIKGDDAIFNIYISGQGLVQQVINVHTCGNPEIDVVLARYLRKWRFAPDTNSKPQWQKIKLTLELKDITGLKVTYVTD